MSETRIIHLPGDKRNFVVGMRWKHEDRPPSAKALRAAAKERGRWVCRRRTSMGSHQTGFASLELGRKAAAMQSLAALVADTKREPWLGVFDLGDGLYWYIAVRDNQEILPDGDVIGSSDDIDAARARHASFGGWDYVDGDAGTVLDLIRSDKARHSFPVVDSQARPWMVPAVGSAVVLVTCAAGVVLWRSHERAVELQRKAILARQQALQDAMKAKVPKPAVILPWTQLASATDFLQTCGNAFNATPLAQEGWVLSAWDCLQQAGGQVVSSQTWTRLGGTDLRTPDGQLSSDGNTVRKVLPLSSHLSPDAGAILSPDSAQRAIRGMSQVLGLPLALTDSAPERPATALPGSPPPANGPKVDTPWTVWSVGIELPAAPWAFGIQQQSDAVPGLRWTRIDWDGAKWALSGSMYVNRATSVSQPTVAAPVRAMPVPMHSNFLSGVPHAN